MSKGPMACLLGALVVTLVGWVGVTPAASQVSTRNDGQGECAERLTRLEAEVRALREQLRIMDERNCNASSSLGRATAPSAADADAPSGATGAHSARMHARYCNPPYRFDRHGIKRYYPDCVDSSSLDACSIPYSFTTSGIKYFKTDCLDAMPSLVSCNQPFTVDTRGVKRYKPECL